MRAGGMEHSMADMTTGTGADSREDILDEPALESVGVDPDSVKVEQAGTPGQDEEADDDQFDDDEEDEEDDDEDDDDGQMASNEEKDED